MGYGFICNFHIIIFIVISYKHWILELFLVIALPF